MAGYNNRQGISAQRLSHCPYCIRLPNLFGYPGVASGFAERDLSGLLPYPALEGGGSGEVKLVSKRYRVTAEVSSEALCYVLEKLRGPVSIIDAVA